MPSKKELALDIYNLRTKLGEQATQLDVLRGEIRSSRVEVSNNLKDLKHEMSYQYDLIDHEIRNTPSFGRPGGIKLRLKDLEDRTDNLENRVASMMSSVQAIVRRVNKIGLDLARPVLKKAAAKR